MHTKQLNGVANNQPYMEKSLAYKNIHVFSIVSMPKIKISRPRGRATEIKQSQNSDHMCDHSQASPTETVETQKEIL